MTSLPPILNRVPTLLTSQIMRGALARASIDVLDMQVKLASGKAINRPSDDPIGTSAVTTLDDIIERRDQRLRNLSHADSVLNNVDSALGSVSDILIEAKGIASSQIGVGSDEQTRENQAKVIDAMLGQITNIANQKYQDMFLFGGSATADLPITERLGGLQYNGTREGLTTDVGLSRLLPITLTGEEAFGALSTRVQGDRDLDPVLTPDTRIADLDGAGARGGPRDDRRHRRGDPALVDLSEAHTVQDVADRIETAIQGVPGNGGATVQIDPISQNRFEITGTVDPVTIGDPASDATAADLGLTNTYPPGGGLGADVDPRITELTSLGALTGVTFPLGTIRLENLGQTRDLDLSSAGTVQDLMNAVHELDLGIRVEIAESGDRLDFVNEVSGGAMSIAEVAGGTTATELGVRSFTGGTELAVFNDGLGVQIRSGSVDPVTGLPDPAADEDFRITIKDGRQFNVDLAGAETVQDVMDAINTAATAAGIAVPAEFETRLASDGNGITLADGTLPAGNPITVEALNGSFAAQDLGILGTTTGPELLGEDRATVAVDSVFAHLIALRDALETNDERGITIAGGKLEADIDRAAEARAEVGVRNRRVRDATFRAEDLQIQDASLRSQIQDLDFTEAALKFSLLQQQLQAGLASAGRISSLSLLDFLG